MDSCFFIFTNLNGIFMSEGWSEEEIWGVRGGLMKSRDAESGQQVRLVRRNDVNWWQPRESWWIPGGAITVDRADETARILTKNVNCLGTGRLVCPLDLSLFTYSTCEVIENTRHLRSLLVVIFFTPSVRHEVELISDFDLKNWGTFSWPFLFEICTRKYIFWLDYSIIESWFPF